MTTTALSELGTGTAALIQTMKELGLKEEVLLQPLGSAPAAVVLPEGRELHSLKKLFDEWREKPERLVQSVDFGTADAFIAYVLRFRTGPTTVFFDADPGKPTMLALLDYHGAEGPSDPSFLGHRARHNFPLSDEMKAWLKAMNGEPMKQEEFAVFLEEREQDIENPPVDWMMVDRDTLADVLAALNLHDDKGPRDEDGNYLVPDTDVVGQDDVSAEPEDERYIPRTALYKLRKIRFGHQEAMMRLARGIEVAQASKVTQSYDHKSGKRRIEFFEDHTTQVAGRVVTVPDMFFIHIPVFDGGERRLLPVKLRYRVRGTQVVWAVEVADARRMVRRAVEAVAAKVADQTGVPVYCGMPQLAAAGNGQQQAQGR